MKPMRLSCFDDRPGMAITLVKLWDHVPVTEELDVETMTFSEEQWAELARRVATEDRAGLSPDLTQPLGPIQEGRQ